MYNMGRTQRHRNKIRNNKANNPNPKIHYSVNALYKYLNSYGWKNETQLFIKNFGNAGRGLASKSGIKTNELLIKIPFASMISLWTLENDLNFVDVLLKSGILNRTDIQYQSLLAFYILYKKHQQDSFLQPYLKSIPFEFDNPYFCNKQELLCLPHNILKAVVAQNEIIREQFEIYNEHLKNISCNDNQFTEIISMEKFKWSYLAVNSRCVFIEPNVISNIIKESKIKKCLRDEARFALAPFLDFLNHSDTVTTKIDITMELKPQGIEYCVFSDKDFNKNEQCFISYGELTNFKLFIDYGFFIPFNKHDFFTFDLDDIENLIKQETSFKNRIFHKNKFKFIRDHNLDDSMFIEIYNGLSHNLVTVLYLIFKEESFYPNVLSQIAFGNYICENDIKIESDLLIASKITEYEKYISDLQNLESLTNSGKVSLDYLNCCILYLKNFLNK